MPLNSETIDLRDEHDRLLDEQAEIADTIADLDPQNPAFDQYARQGSTIDEQLDGLEWAIDAWDVDDPIVTLEGPTGGELGLIEDLLASDADRQQLRGQQRGAKRVYTVALCTDAAPYLDGGEDTETAIGKTGQLPLQYLKWAETRISELVSVGNEDRNRFSQLVAEKRQQSHPTSGQSG